ncbi:MAG: hypothetical protein ACO3IB_12625, partial [Phycisphaerales bacterium]
MIDACDLAAGAPDCNANGRIDSCDIASGTTADCDSNGVPDLCEGYEFVDVTRVVQVATGTPVWATFDDLPLAASSAVSLEVRAIADLGNSDDALLVRVETGDSEVLFLTDGVDCPAQNLATIQRSRDDFNALLGDRSLAVRVAGLCSLNTQSCAGGGVTLRLRYFAITPSADCNGNGELDRCDIASGASTDLDGDGVPDECSGQYIVGGSGFASIDAASAAAPQGAVIRVASGIYGPFTMPTQAVSVVALADAEVVVDAGGVGRCLTQHEDGTDALVRGLIFVNGFADAGAGASVLGGVVRFEDCVFASCVAQSAGGAVEVVGAEAYFFQCRFEDNAAARGGAISVGSEIGTAVSIDSCVLRSSHASEAGGGLLNEGSLLVMNSFVLGCTAPAVGGAELLEGSETVILATRFCGNSAEHVSEGFEDRGGNVFGDDCDGDGLCDVEEISQDSDTDCNGNGLLDSCEVADATSDADADGRLDS